MIERPHKGKCFCLDCLQVDIANIENENDALKERLAVAEGLLHRWLSGAEYNALRSDIRAYLTNADTGYVAVRREDLELVRPLIIDGVWSGKGIEEDQKAALVRIYIAMDRSKPGEKP